MQDGYRLAQMDIHPESWLAGKTLSEANVADEGILILGIYRPNGNYVGAPQGETSIKVRDRIVVYGHDDAINQISHRLLGNRGDQEHLVAMTKQNSMLKKQQVEDEQYSDYSGEE